MLTEQASGMQVHGDALLTYCRLRPNEWGTPVVSRRSFTVGQFWMWVACFLPEFEYAVGRSQLMMARLPPAFRCRAHRCNLASAALAALRISNLAPLSASPQA